MDSNWEKILEIMKTAGDHEWWEMFTESQQREYLSKHPDSDLKINPNSKATKTNELLKNLPKSIIQELNDYQPGMRAWISDRIIGNDLKGQYRSVAGRLEQNPNDYEAELERDLLLKLMHRKINRAHGRIEKIERWFHAIKPDLNKLDLDEAVEQSRPWRRLQKKLDEKEAILKERGDQSKIGDTGFTAVELQKPSELRAEGAEMTHCVGGYCRAVKSGRAKIISIKDPGGRSVATIEVGPKRNPDDRWEVKQIKGKQNKIPKQYQNVIEEWLKKSGYDYIESHDYKRLQDDSQVDDSNNNQVETAPDSFEMMESVISSGKIPREYLNQYNNDTSKFLREIKFANADLLEKFGDRFHPSRGNIINDLYGDYYFRNAITGNPELPKTKLFEKIIREIDNTSSGYGASSIAEGLSKNPSLTFAQRRLFIPTTKNTKHMSTSTIFKNPNIGEEDIDALIRDYRAGRIEDDKVRTALYELSSREQFSEELIRKVLAEGMPGSALLIKRPETPISYVEDMVSKLEEYTKIPGINPERSAIDKLFPAMSGWDNVSSRKDLPTDLGERLFEQCLIHGREYQGVNLISNKIVRPEVVLKHKKSPYARVREAVVQDTRIPYEQIADMANDENKDVRHSVRARKDQWKTKTLRKNLEKKEKYDEKLDHLSKFKEEMKNLRHIAQIQLEFIKLSTSV